MNRNLRSGFVANVIPCWHRVKYSDAPAVAVSFVAQRTAGREADSNGEAGVSEPRVAVEYHRLLEITVADVEISDVNEPTVSVRTTD